MNEDHLIEKLNEEIKRTETHLKELYYMLTLVKKGLGWDEEKSTKK